MVTMCYVGAFDKSFINLTPWFSVNILQILYCFNSMQLGIHDDGGANLILCFCQHGANLILFFQYGAN